MRTSFASAPVVAIASLGVLLILGPVIATVWIAFTLGIPGHGEYSLANFSRVALDPFGYRVIGNTLIFATGATAIALAIAAPLAWAVARTDIPFRRSIILLLGMILVVPGFLQAMGWALLLSPNIGIVNQYLMEWFSLDSAPFNIFSLGGMTFAEGLGLVPPAYFIISAVFSGMDGSLEEAASMSGAGKFRTFVRINLPLAVPALAAAAIYVFVLAFAVFEVPMVLGFPDRIFVFSTMLYLIVQLPQSGLPEYGAAAAYGCLVMFASLVMAHYYIRLIGNTRKYTTITGKGRRSKTLKLGKWRPLACILISAYFLLALGLPLIVLIYFSLLPYFQLPSMEALAAMNLQNYVDVYTRQGARPLINTGILVATVPIAVVIIATAISWVVVRSRLRARFIFDSIAFLPIAIPRIVLAVAILYLALSAREIVPIYATLAVLVLAQIIAFISFATRTLNGAILQIHPDLEDAGRLSGASLFTTLRKITAPLLGPALFAAWFWVLLLSFREVTIAVMLTSADSIVLPVQVWNLWNTVSPNQAAAAAVMLAVIALGLMLAMRRIAERVFASGGH